MNTNIQGDFQICTSVPLKKRKHFTPKKGRQFTNKFVSFSLLQTRKDLVLIKFTTM